MVNVLAQAYDTLPSDSGSAAGGLVFMLIYLAVIAVAIAGMWKLFVKAGQPGWAAIVPIYNTYVLVKIAGKPDWWFLLFLVPFVNVIAAVIIGGEVAKRFGKSDVFGYILCGLLGIGYVILGFDSSKYTASPSA